MAQGAGLEDMRTTKLIRSGFVVAAGLFLCGTAVADNCTGYNMLVTTSADTRDLGNKMTLTTFQAESILTSAMKDLTTRGEFYDAIGATA